MVIPPGNAERSGVPALGAQEGVEDRRSYARCTGMTEANAHCAVIPTMSLIMPSLLNVARVLSRTCLCDSPPTRDRAREAEPPRKGLAPIACGTFHEPHGMIE